MSRPILMERWAEGCAFTFYSMYPISDDTPTDERIFAEAIAIDEIRKYLSTSNVALTDEMSDVVAVGAVTRAQGLWHQIKEGEHNSQDFPVMVKGVLSPLTKSGKPEVVVYDKDKNYVSRRDDVTIMGDDQVRYFLAVLENEEWVPLRTAPTQNW